MEERNIKVEEAVKKWLSERGYDCLCFTLVFLDDIIHTQGSYREVLLSGAGR